MVVLNLIKENEIKDSIEQEVLNRLHIYKANFIEEWKNSQTINLEIRNYQRLNNINIYIERKLKS